MLSDSRLSPSSLPPRDEEARGVSPDAHKRLQLLEDCREMVVVRLCQVINEALARVDEELGDMALRSDRREEQRAFMDAALVVRQNRGEIEARFRKAFIDCFERRLFGKRDDGAQAASFDGELSLVDDAVISDKLSVDRLVHKARGKLDPDEVLGMRARLAALLERDWFEEAQHPVAPEAVFEALKNALAELAPAQEVQTALLDAFEPHVSSQLNQVYSTVNTRLKANQVLPKIRPQVAINRNIPRRAAGAGNPATAAAAAGAAAPAASGAVPGAGASAAAGPGVMAGQAGWPIDAPNFAGAGGEPFDFGLTMQQFAQGVPAARQSVARMLTDPDSFGVADLPLPSPQPRLIDSISHLQASTAHAALGAPQVFAEIVERTRDAGSPLDQLTFEIVSLVFDYIYADKRLAPQIKQQLLRLQVVAVKAALLDRSFFARRKHPMRRLIDRISEIATDPDSNVEPDSPLTQAMEQLVDWVITSFDRDLATFDEALQRLERIAQQEADRRAERLEQITRAAECEEAIASAAAQARKLLADRADESTPPFVRDFLLDWWSRVMGHAAVNEADGAMRAAEALQVAEALVWSVTPKLPDEISRLATLLPRLINGLIRGLKLAAMPDQPRELFFNELLRMHTRAIEAAKQAHAQKVAASRAVSRIRMRADGTIQYTAPRTETMVPGAATRSGDSPTVTARGPLADLQRGDRIEIDEGDETLGFKLAWISPTQKLYILSRFPDDARSLDAQAFAALFSAGRARLVERRSAVDRAIDMAGSAPELTGKGGGARGSEAPAERTPAAPDGEAASPATIARSEA